MDESNEESKVEVESINPPSLLIQSENDDDNDNDNDDDLEMQREERVENQRVELDRYSKEKKALEAFKLRRERKILAGNILKV